MNQITYLLGKIQITYGKNSTNCWEKIKYRTHFRLLIISDFISFNNTKESSIKKVKLKNKIKHFKNLNFENSNFIF